MTRMESSFLQSSAGTSSVLGSLLLNVCLACACHSAQLAIGEPVFYGAEDDDAGGQYNCRFRSTLIVLGRILAVNQMQESQVKGAYGTPLHRIEVECDIEEVLSGAVAPGRKTFHGFVMLSPGPLQRRGNLHAVDYRPGQRRIFFLRFFRGGLRLARDNYDYSILVSTGLHARSANLRQAAQERAAYLLLIPGGGADKQAWLSSFGMRLGIAALIAGPQTAYDTVIRNKQLISTFVGSLKWNRDLEDFREALPLLVKTIETEENERPCLDFGQAKQ